MRVRISRKDIEYAKGIRSLLAPSPDSYFSHTGGKVTLSQARKVWDMAKHLAYIIVQAELEEWKRKDKKQKNKKKK